jgi:hypothetical protein
LTEAEVTTTPKYKAEGQRGSWFANVNGETLPCVHKHWLKKDLYHDPNAYRQNSKKWDDLIAAIRDKKRVILTDDNVKDELQSFERTGYIAVFEIDDVSLDGFDLRFRFTKRTANLF